jgi:hypothetical protein
MIRRYSIFLLCFIFISCGNKNKTVILAPKKMQLVLWDILQADAFSSNFQTKDSSNTLNEKNVILQKQIFAFHKVTKEEFYNSFTYYKEHTEAMKAIIDSMINKANAERYNPANKNIINNLKGDTAHAKTVL